MVTISIRKPNLQWLFGGLGFHNSEATMLGLLTPEFLEERVLKSHFEISPTFTRVFAAFPDWTQEAMDRFADYYDLTFRKPIRRSMRFLPVCHFTKRTKK